MMIMAAILLEDDRCVDQGRKQTVEADEDQTIYSLQPGSGRPPISSGQGVAAADRGSQLRVRPASYATTPTAPQKILEHGPFRQKLT
jgi:hypothetical protein